MKHLSITIFLLSAFLIVKSQKCDSSQLDPRVADALRTWLPDLQASPKTSIEQIRDVKIKSPDFPEADIEYVKVTPDSIPIQVYNPLHKTGLPIIISYHPGGFVTPLLSFMKYDFWKQANTFKAIVFAVDYRVAPEHKYPAAVNDSYNAFKWIINNAAKYGGDTSRVILMGSSAGGNLAVVVTQKAKKEGIAHRIKLQVMNCPSTDNPRNSGKYPSYQRYASGYFLTKNFCEYYIQAYAPDEPLNNPEIGPVNAGDLSGLPPAVVFTAQYDPFHDEGETYAYRLKAAGVPLWYKCFPGQIHCLLGLPQEAEELKQADELIKTAMRETMISTSISFHSQ